MKLLDASPDEAGRGTWRIEILVRRIDLAVVVSLLLHVAFFALPGPRVPPPSPAASQPLEVVLVTPSAAVVTPPETPDKRPVEKPAARPLTRLPSRVAPPSPQPEATPIPAPVPAPTEAP